MGKKCEPGCQCGRHRHVLSTSYQKICQWCSSEFTAKRSDARFCSGVCHAASYNSINEERIREVKRRWAVENRDKVRESQRKWQEKYGEEARLKKLDAYRTQDREELRARSKADYRKHREKRLEYARNRRQSFPTWRGKYGPLQQIWDSFWEAQGGKCYLCGSILRKDIPRSIQLDHDHSCCPLGRSCEKCRRGLACTDCNILIGRAGDDPDRLHRIANNLASAKEEVRRRMN
jgi:hypothetical protein